MVDVAASISRTVAYLLPTPSSYWRWSGDGKWIEWSDGRTLVHRDQLTAVVERLAPRGLPGIGAILLLLAACRPNWDAEAARRAITAAATQEKLGDGFKLVDAVLARRLDQTLSEVLGDLAALAGLPKDLRESVAAQAALAEYVFDGAVAVIDAATAGEIAALLWSGIDRDTLGQVRVNPRGHDELPEDLQSLQLGLARVAAEPVATWFKTGISAPVQPAEIEVPLPQRVRALVGELRDDPELGGLANLATDLLAALHVPRTLVSREDLPLGGVSDISNRGPLDRLLISELAHDELTLAIRVALGEAMYLRREAPAHHPQVTRHLLIDAGIRLWGIPRLFATAVALALAASSDKRSVVQAHRAAGPAVHACDLATRQGLLDHLAVLRPEPDPAPALRTLLQATSADQSEETEVFLITHEDAFADVRAGLTSELAVDADLYVATVSREGEFVLWWLSAAGRREISRVQLSVEKLFPPTSSAPLELLTRDAKFPMILRREMLPLRLPAVIAPRQAVRIGNLGLAAVTNDRRLMLWTDRNRGGLQLSDALPPGNIEGVFADVDGPAVHLVVYTKKNSMLTVLTSNLRDPCCRISVRRNKPVAMSFHQRRLLLMYQNEVRVLDPLTGEDSAYAVTNHDRHRNGRFYCGNSHWFAAGVSGLERVCPAWADTIALFDRPSLGPWRLLKDLSVQPADGSSPKQGFTPVRAETVMPAQIRSITASQDGNYLVIEGKKQATSNAEVSWWVFNLLKWTVYPTGDIRYAYEMTLWDIGQQAITHGVNLRRSFDSIARDRAGRIVLVKGRKLSTLMENERQELIWADSGLNTVGSGVTHFRSFQVAESPTGTSFRLRRAQWSDGSEAWLDSRGMLHLLSSDRRLPQVTLTIGQSSSAAWTSDGQTAGWKYFVDETSDGATTAIDQLVREFAARLGA